VAGLTVTVSRVFGVWTLPSVALATRVGISVDRTLGATRLGEDRRIYDYIKELRD